MQDYLFRRQGHEWGSPWRPTGGKSNKGKKINFAEGNICNCRDIKRGEEKEVGHITAEHCVRTDDP